MRAGALRRQLPCTQMQAQQALPPRQPVKAALRPSMLLQLLLAQSRRGLQEAALRTEQSQTQALLLRQVLQPSNL